ncbi:MAG TPA: YceI family protein [Rudaea sp.]|nr:YceI family protein [Rudaea sp.]
MLLIPLALSLIPLHATARDWQVDPAKSTLEFKGTYQNGPFAGKFKKFEAAIALDENDVAKDKFDVKVDVASVDSGSSERDDTLRTPDFFDPPKYPQARFVTQSFGKGADGGLEAKGTLTIRDQTKPVTLKVKFAPTGDSATLDVDTVLHRLDFNLGAGSDWADIGKDVNVHGHLVLTGK